jgi:pyruvate/2-oxoglutarate dehydrogenase complex dihydrolipoamide acyltransferase (E2) component
MALLQEIKVPLLSVNDTSLIVVEMNFENGAKVKSGDVLMVFETSKTTCDVQAEAEGYVQYFCETQDEYEVNETVAKIFSSTNDFEIRATGPAVDQKMPAVPAPETNNTHWEGQTIFSERALRLIESAAVNASLFNGKDFVNAADVEALLGRPSTAGKKPASIAQAVKPVPSSPIDHTQVILEKIASGKKKEIQYLSDIQSTGLTSTINTVVETAGIFAQVNKSFAYLKNSLLPLIIYESARLLKKYTVLNAYYTPEGIAVYREVNIGFAIDIEKGLKVLKLPLADKKGLAEIEAGIMELSGKYLDDTLEVSDLTGISFTITDLSAEAVSFFTPLVNTMNSAILGISAIDEQLERCTLSITFDHRVTEGKQVSRFLKELKDRLQSYSAGKLYRTYEIMCFKCGTPLAEDLSDTGFVACIKTDGEKGYICQRCFKGF